MLPRIAFAVVAVMAPLTVATPVTAAGAAVGRVTITQHEFKAEIVIEHIENPCTGIPGTLTEVENGVFHLTAAGLDIGDPDDPADDRPIAPYGSTFNVENRFAFVPDVRGAPSYFGHSHTHISEQFKTLPGVTQFENTIQARGDDGSVLRLHEVARALVDADGSMTITMDRASCLSG
jgi:hypothetical protein